MATGAVGEPDWSELAARWKPVPKRPGYALGVIVLGAGVILLPLLYFAIVASVGYGVYWHLANNSPEKIAAAVMGRPRVNLVSIFLYILPAAGGIALILLMLKPLVAPRGDAGDPIVLEEFEESRLHTFVGNVCAAMGAPAPKRIDINCDVNASASFRSGLVSVFQRGDMVLTIGLPLVAGMSKREFAGVLAHELGHFSQGTGLRVSYLGMRMVQWFLEAAYRRDGWDVLLYQMSYSTDILYRLLAWFARACIGLGRLAIKVLALAAMAFCSVLLKQMEFDADRYEVQMAGSASFPSAFRRLAELGEAYPKAMEESRRMFNSGSRLPDDFPALVADYARRLTPEARDELIRRSEEKSNTLLSTHPSTAARLAAAANANDPGLYTDESPASELFTDFFAACRKATYGHFSGVLGGYPAGVTFVPTGPLLRASGDAQAGGDATSRYFGFEPPTWRPIFPAISKVPAGGDARAILDRLKAAKADLKAAAGRAGAAATQFRSMSEEIGKWEQARAIMDSGMTVDFKSLGLKATTRAGVSQRLDTLGEKSTEHVMVMDEAGDAAMRRMAAALALLGAKGIEQLIPDAPTRRARADALLATSGPLRDILPIARRVRLHVGTLSGIGDKINSEKALEKLKAFVRPVSDQVRDELDSARRIGGGVRDPVSRSEASQNLGETLVGATPAWRDIEEIILAGDTFVDRFGDTYRRVLGELVGEAEGVEKAVALAMKKRAKAEARA
ncbi:MAG: M48 family metalloprotease [Phycisphaeraceae bacterium]|nr:M48 family metalloprotease [Phycisphaeraceae bacterium]